MTAPTPLFYRPVVMPGRDNVRWWAVNPPELRLVRPSGKIVVVELSEPELIAIVREAAAALEVYVVSRAR